MNHRKNDLQQQFIETMATFNREHFVSVEEAVKGLDIAFGKASYIFDEAKITWVGKEQLKDGTNIIDADS